MSQPYKTSEKGSERKPQGFTHANQSEDGFDPSKSAIHGGITYSSQAIQKGNPEGEDDDPIDTESIPLHGSAGSEGARHREHDSRRVIYINPYFNPQTYVYILCSCPVYPVGPSEAWKEALARCPNTSYDDGLVMALLGAVCWNNLSCCDDHILALGNLVGFKETRVSLLRDHLLQYGQHFEDIQSYKEIIPHLLKIIGTNI